MLTALGRVLLMTVRPFRRAGQGFDVNEGVQTFFYWANVPGIPTVVGVFQSSIPGVNKLYPWASPLIAAGIVLFAFVLIAAVRIQRKLDLLTIKRLKVEVAGPYPVSGEATYLRLKVTNESGIPIQECYGRLISIRSFIHGEGANEGKSILFPLDGLPPDNHWYPWSWTNPSPVEETAPPNVPIYLYVAFKRRKQEWEWFTPTETGPAYRQPCVGMFEMTVAVGSLSNTEPFPATRVRMVLNTATKNIKLEDFELVN